MKQTVTIIIFLLFALHGFAQKIRISDMTNRWTGYNYDFAPFMESFTTGGYNGDTVINNLKYSKSLAFNLLVRDDTVANKVYCRAISSSTSICLDSNETLLYDYNLVVGDTFTRHCDNITFKHWVVSLDSALINSTWHKIWRFTGAATPSTYTAGPYTVIEGIGAVNSYSASLISCPLYPLSFETARFISCFSNQYGQPAINANISLPRPYPQGGNYIFNNTTSCTLAVTEQQERPNNKIICPNPANNNSEIKCAQLLQKADITIYNSIGQKVYNAVISNQNSIPIGTYISIPGQYFYRIYDKGVNEVYTGKFIFE